MTKLFNRNHPSHKFAVLFHIFNKIITPMEHMVYPKWNKKKCQDDGKLSSQTWIIPKNVHNAIFICHHHANLNKHVAGSCPDVA